MKTCKLCCIQSQLSYTLNNYPADFHDVYSVLFLYVFLAIHTKSHSDLTVRCLLDLLGYSKANIVQGSFTIFPPL